MARDRFAPKVPTFGVIDRRNLISYGPVELGLQKATKQTPLCGDPPPGFVGGTTSATEWIVWCLLRNVIFKTEPGEYGSMGRWLYQETFGQQGTGGAAQVDFVLNLDRYDVGLRIQTYQFHFAKGSFVHAYDANQKANLESWSGLYVIDIWEHEVLADPVNHYPAIRAILDAMQLVQHPNPLVTGMTWGSG